MIHEHFNKTVPFNDWHRPQLSQYQDIIERLKRLEDSLGIPPCEDKEKAKWLREVQDRLEKLEKAPLASPLPATPFQSRARLGRDF